MEIKTTLKNEVTIIEMSGNLDANSSTQAQDEIMPFLKQGCRIVLNMSKCPYVSSAGLRLLLTIAKRLKAIEGRWCLAGLSDEIKDVMEMTGFSSFFETYKTINEAIEAVQKG